VCGGDNQPLRPGYTDRLLPLFEQLNHKASPAFSWITDADNGSADVGDETMVLRVFEAHSVATLVCQHSEHDDGQASAVAIMPMTMTASRVFTLRLERNGPVSRCAKTVPVGNFRWALLEELQLSSERG
jgi:hypothetical protein